LDSPFRTALGKDTHDPITRADPEKVCQLLRFDPAKSATALGPVNPGAYHAGKDRRNDPEKNQHAGKGTMGHVGIRITEANGARLHATLGNQQGSHRDQKRKRLQAVHR